MMDYKNYNEVMEDIVQFLKMHDIPFVIEKKSQYTNYIFDIYLPNGLKNAKGIIRGETYESFNIDGPTVIEIKRRLLFDTISRYSGIYSELSAQKEVSSFLLVYVEGNVSHFAYNYIEKRFNGRFRVLSLQDFLNRSLPEKKKDTQRIANAYNWEEDGKKALEIAKVCLAENDFNLFLGAGVSMSADLPSWRNLLSSMVEKNNHKQFKTTDICNITKVCSDSSIVMGRFVRMMMEKKSNDEDYYQCLHDALYGGISAYRSPLIDEICNLVDSKKIASPEHHYL